MYRIGDTLNFNDFPFSEVNFQGDPLTNRQIYLIYMGPISMREMDINAEDKETSLFAFATDYEYKEEIASEKAFKFLKSKFPMFHKRCFLYFSDRLLAIHPEKLKQGKFMVTGNINQETMRLLYMGYFAHQTLPYKVLRNIKRNFTGARIRNLPMPVEPS